MGKLQNFSNRDSGKTRYEPSRRPLPDYKTNKTGRVPEGYDPDVWFLASVFESFAEQDQVSLGAGLPVIYLELKQRIDHSGIRDLNFPYTGDQLQEMFQLISTLMAERLFSVPVYTLTGPMWRRWVELMMVEFWTYTWDQTSARPLDVFTSIHDDSGQGFADLWEQLVLRYGSYQLVEGR